MKLSSVSRRIVAFASLAVLVHAVPSANAWQEHPMEAVLVDASGKTVKLSQWRGKSSVVLLFMRGFKGDFACYYCGNQTRAYKDAYARLHAAGAEVITVLPGAKEVGGFLEKVGTGDNEHPDPKFTVPFPVATDAEFSACRTFSVAFDPSPDAFPFPVSEPATIVIGKDGHVVYSYHGTSPPDRPNVDAILDVLAHGPQRNGVKPNATAAAPPAPPASTLPWKSYTEGMALAHAQGQPVLLDFHALW